MEFTLNNKILKKENEEHQKLFKKFHKCIFCQITKEAIIMAVDVLLNHGIQPTDTDFEEKSNNLVKTILEKKIEMLGSYLR